MTRNPVHFLPAIEIETGLTQPDHAVIWLHGLGADGNDFVPVVRELEIPPEVSIRFVFPHAPERPVSINNGYVMRAWYDIYQAAIDRQQDEAGIRASQKAIDQLIQREVDRGISSKNIFLAGFSQGGAMALQAGLRQTLPLAGIIALSCYLPLAEMLDSEASVANASIPILMMHGTYDSVVPLALAISSREKLLSAKYSLQWHEYPMAHSVCTEEINDISRWLQRKLDPQIE
ncbi:MAG: dienelactone hydrolase family protein [Nitrosomonas sp.]|uniref:alpha/beta hydrolase n=1 Tax=Nitrosomonas sp. TaxID=42353 RepID=UPI001D31EB74|nr:dienelactone hydrolase family protein [Nitrosomonas sp.]MBX9895186.1 dienelactone hydrolase family protein [Nitrosomonas sp.]